MTSSAERHNRWNASRWRLAMWATIAALLLLPLLAMQVTDEVDWSAADFLAAGILLVGAGSIYEIAARNTQRPLYRRVIAVLIILAVLLIWLQGAVGIF